MYVVEILTHDSLNVMPKVSTNDRQKILSVIEPPETNSKKSTLVMPKVSTNDRQKILSVIEPPETNSKKSTFKSEP